MQTAMGGAAAEPPRVWAFGVDAIDAWHYDKKVMQRHPDTTIVNSDEYAEHLYLLAKKYGMVESGRYPFPPDFPILILNYPSQDGFLPDLFRSSRLVCSARLREAMALPPGVVQYLPLEVKGPDPRVHAMSYQVLRVLAHQPTVDFSRSDVDVEEKTDRHIGGTYMSVQFSSQLALRTDLEPQTDLFHAAEMTTRNFATDALAERVMRAGCWGVCFEHPEEPSFWDQPHTIRTARGIEKAGPRARRAHLRLVKQARAARSASP